MKQFVGVAAISQPFLFCLFYCSHSTTTPQNGSAGKLSHLVDNNDCLYCLIKAVPVDFGRRSGVDEFQFDCLTDANEEVGILAEIPYRVDLPLDFVEEHMGTLQRGLSTVCIPGGRAIRFPNSTFPDQIVIPDGAELRLIPGLVDPGDGNGLGFGNRTVLVVRVSGTAESLLETVAQMEGSVFGLGGQPLINSVRAQFGRCSFSKMDFVPATGFDQFFFNGVVNIQLPYSLRGRNVLRVLGDAMAAVGELLQIDSLEGSFNHLIFCFARGTTLSRSPDWLAFATLRGYTSAFNSGRCDSLTALMHEIGHNLGLVHSAADIFEDEYGDTTGVVSCLVCVYPLSFFPFSSSLDWYLTSTFLAIFLCCVFVALFGSLQMGYR